MTAQIRAPLTLPTLDALGLATQAELDTHALTPHGGGVPSGPRALDVVGDYGAVPYQTLAAAQTGIDSTSAFILMLGALAAAGGGRGTVEPGFYRIGGPLLNTGNGNAQIPLPLVDGSTAAFLSIELWCPQPAGVASWYTGPAGKHGAILVSTLAASSYSGALGMPSVIGGPTLEYQGQPYNSESYFVGYFTAIHMALRGIAVMNPSNPTRTAFDFGLVSSVTVESCRADQTSAPNNVQPTNAHAWGLVMPRGFNHVASHAEEFHCQGYFVGASFDEHCTMDRFSLVDCEVGLVPTGRDKHPAALRFVNSEQNHFDIAQVNPATGVIPGGFNQNRAWFGLECLNIEDKPTFTEGDWRDKRTGANVYDPYNNLVAVMRKARYVVSQGYDQGPMKVVGGAQVRVEEHTSGQQLAIASTVSMTAANSTSVLPARTQALNDPNQQGAVSNVRTMAALQRSGTWGIIADKAYWTALTPNGGTFGAVAVWEWFHADGTLSIPVATSAGTTYARIIMRSKDKDNYVCVDCYCGATSSNLTFNKVVAGVQTQLGAGVAGLMVPGTTYVVSLQLAGLAAVVKLDGVTKITASITTPLDRDTLLSSYHGIGATGGAGSDDGGTRFGDIAFAPKLG